MYEDFRTADLHVSHHNIIEYAGRPYTSIEEMNEALIDNWNAVVKPGDRVTIHGDLVMGRIAESLPMVARLNGDKVLILGNHDRPWPGNSEKSRRGWAEQYEAVGLRLIALDWFDEEIKSGLKVRSSHFPYVGDSHDTDRFTDHRPPDKGDWLLHGHVHEAWKVRGRMINVGVDVWDYTPVHIDTLVEIIEKGVSP